MGNFQIAVRAVIIADYRQPIRTYSDGAVPTHITPRVHRGEAACAAGSILTMGDFQIAVRVIPITNHGQSIRTNGDGSIRTNFN